MPKVSVIMTCYNHEKYVGEAIESVLIQSYTDFEFLIVDNGCTDGSYNIIQSFHDPRIKLFRLEKNDPEKAGYLLLQNQTGKYIAQMHSDDIWEKDKLEKQMLVLEEQSDILVAATWSVFTDEEMNLLEWSREIFQKKNCSRLQWIRRLLEGGNCLSATSLIAESNLYKSLCISYGYWQLSDYYLWLIILKKTNIYVVEEVLVKQRFHTIKENTNISFPNEENHIRVIAETGNIVLHIIEDLEDADFLEMYRDKLINKNANTHLETICEKFFLLLEYAKRNYYYEENVLSFFYKYYSYKENDISVSEVLKEKYKYSYMDFRKISATMGIAALNIRKEKQIEYFRKKMRNLLPVKEKETLEKIDKELTIFIVKLQRGYLNVEILEQMVIDLEELLLIWDWLSYMEISIKKEEIELCKQLCSVYQKNLNIADGNELLKNILRYQKAIQELIV